MDDRDELQGRIWVLEVRHDDNMGKNGFGI